jgi:hypothetical protein
MICHNCQRPKECVARVLDNPVCEQCKNTLALCGFAIREI